MQKQYLITKKQETSDSAYFSYYQLPYSIDLAALGKFEEAEAAIDRFLASPKLSEKSVRSGMYRKKSYQFAIDYKNTHADDGYVFTPGKSWRQYQFYARQNIILRLPSTIALFVFTTP